MKSKSEMKRIGMQDIGKLVAELAETKAKLAKARQETLREVRDAAHEGYIKEIIPFYAYKSFLKILEKLEAEREG